MYYPRRAHAVARLPTMTTDGLFPLESELCKLLKVETSGPLGKLLRTEASKDCLPGQPRTLLERQILLPYLKSELLTPELDRLAPHLWLTSTPSSSHISPLHHQQVRGRTVVVAENPSLHLVWHHNRIFIKPVPPYLLSQAFWRFLPQDHEIYRAARGFLRTYAFLIHYECDFQRATSPELRLIPPDDGYTPITFERFAELISHVARIPDDETSPRYGYGELRLTRLNKLAKVFLGKMTFHHVEPQLGSFIGSYLAPFLTFFAVVSVALSAMQVQLATQTGNDGDGSWTAFTMTSRWFSISALLLIVILVGSVLGLFFFVLLHECLFARRLIRQRGEGPRESPMKKRNSAVV
ncbi:hypothetical protein GGR56DRAFT_630399 [Xylariaceae sp. FL0804]|nr:hypothetical protein GGR56DRAFT_630399 [Xylariaceae sp. FL0804]